MMRERALPARSSEHARAGGILTLLWCLSACSLQTEGKASLTDRVEQSDAAPASVDQQPSRADAAALPDDTDEREPTLDAGSPMLDAMLPEVVADAGTQEDGDAGPDGVSLCPGDAGKIEPGVCGCDLPDTDKDGDAVADCIDACPSDHSKSEAGACGCGKDEHDRDRDGVPDCIDACPRDPDKVAEGACGCGKDELDSNGDGTPDCKGGWLGDKIGRRGKALWWLPRFSTQR